ncbi:spore coat protein U domain-containing protein [Rickettsiales bacterium]|nr:spore coat protein U domain-containing protein [Rickettsiales bacterium]MDB2550483.1 spore coat protein U domain-containing protein [Rickettsiales bacterium]
MPRILFLTLYIITIFLSKISLADISNPILRNNQSEEVEVSLVIPRKVIVNINEDINFGTLNRQNNAQENKIVTKLCVFSNSGSFKIKATSNNSDNHDFRLKNDDQYLNYNLKLVNIENNSEINLQSNQMLNNNNLSAAKTKCNQKNYALISSIDNNNNNLSGSYNDILTLYISPA